MYKYRDEEVLLTTVYSNKMGKIMELITFIISYTPLLCDSLNMVDCLKGQDLWTGDPCVDKADKSSLGVMIYQSLAEATKDEKKAMRLYKVLQNLKRLDLPTYEILLAKMPSSLREALSQERSPVTWSEFLLENVMTLCSTIYWTNSLYDVLRGERILSAHDKFHGCSDIELFTKLVDIVIKKDHAVTFLTVLRAEEDYAFSELWCRMPPCLRAEFS